MVEQNIVPQTPEITEETKTIIQARDSEEAIKKLKTRKACGKDGIHNDLLKYGGTKLTR